ncbi:hypothetical protein GS884_26155 [Rhodococcus hoagii]|nr:hypothetical protein [Prescottella equi]
MAVIHKVPDTVAADEIAAAEKLPADAAGSTTPDELTKVGPTYWPTCTPPGTHPMSVAADADAGCGSGNKTPI